MKKKKKKGKKTVPVTFAFLNASVLFPMMESLKRRQITTERRKTKKQKKKILINSLNDKN